MTKKRPMMVGAATVVRHSAIAAPMTAAAQGSKLARRSRIGHQENAK
jgi:hypothetical protein